jgi:hypothetical protein
VERCEQERELIRAECFFGDEHGKRLVVDLLRHLGEPAAGTRRDPGLLQDRRGERGVFAERRRDQDR